MKRLLLMKSAADPMDYEEHFNLLPRRTGLYPIIIVGPINATINQYSANNNVSNIQLTRESKGKS